MCKQSLRNAGKVASIFVLCLMASTLSLRGEDEREGKIVGGYFEEWSIYGANYNIANLQQNGVADKVTQLMYAFANVTTTHVRSRIAGQITRPPICRVSVGRPTPVPCTEISQPFSN